MSHSFARWADRIRTLAARLGEIERRTRDWPVSAPSASEWYGELTQKLTPQASGEPYLIVAVCGGTNTGKSVVLNHLAGAEISRSHAEATRTKHPVCSVPRGFTSQHDLAQVFPGFTIRPWNSLDDALGDEADNLLFWREDPTGKQPMNLLLLDTPDVDGVLSANHRRAEATRHAADVVVAILTQQKYNDAAVRDFFQAAAAADKTIVVVFNMVHWPRQAETVRLWLSTFEQETGAQPYAVYATPWDDTAAEELRLPFHPLSVDAVDPRRDLAELRFDEIKLRALSGSLRIVLDQRDGLPRWMSEIARTAGEYGSAYGVLADDLRLPIRILPTLPKHLLWEQIWTWLDRHRNPIERAVNRAMSLPGKWLADRFRETPQQEENRYRDLEWDAFRVALEDFLERLATLRRGGNAIVRSALAQAAPLDDRRRIFDTAQTRYRDLPLMTDEYRRYVDAELATFARDYPGLLRGITWSLIGTAVVRPVVTIGLGFFGAHAVDLAGGHLFNIAGDVVVGAATAAGGEGVMAGAMLPVKNLLARIFDRFYAERGRLLADILHDLILGDSILNLRQRAELVATPAWKELVNAVEALKTE